MDYLGDLDGEGGGKDGEQGGETRQKGRVEQVVQEDSASALSIPHPPCIRH